MYMHKNVTSGPSQLSVLHYNVKEYVLVSCIKRISASISLTVGSVSYLPGLLITNTQICK